MSENHDHSITGDEIEILQEIMNIAFGKATADLAEFIDIFIKLSVPNVQITKTINLGQYLNDVVTNNGQISIVEQKFWGKFRGYALLVFPSGSGKELISILAGEVHESFVADPIDELEKGTLMEVGNILIGACIGKIAEILNDVMTYSPPSVLLERHTGNIIPSNIFNPDDNAIILKTIFKFENKEVAGMLLLLISHESIYWLKKALNEFMEQYE
jgi:chemotaxis protein CheC